MKIVFLGTPDFAVESLKSIIENNFNVVGVVTAPDKPAGRGMQLQQSAVKKYALTKGLKVLQPVKLKDEEFLQELRSLQADLQVVIAFRMLPEVVWNMPSLGTINLHASLLPDYRGAAPINWAVINGETKTGVSTFFLKHEIDTGDIILKNEVPITSATTAGELHDVLMHVGAKTIVDSLNLIKEGNYQTTPQGIGSTKIAPKIFTETCQINWNNSTQNVYNLIRGLSPYPAAFTSFKSKKLKIFNATFFLAEPTIKPGEFETDEKTYLRFACEDGFINVTDLQLESKKRMTITEFLRGVKFI